MPPQYGDDDWVSPELFVRSRKRGYYNKISDKSRHKTNYTLQEAHTYSMRKTQDKYGAGDTRRVQETRQSGTGPSSSEPPNSLKSIVIPDSGRCREIR